MSDNTSEVIGQGTYGCVHSPPLLCKESSEKDLKNVSKLLTSSEASKEMKEYVLINNIDQNKDYYLGQPTQCKVSTKKSNKRAIRDCNISEDVFDQYDNYSLLIMKNGGLNLIEPPGNGSQLVTLRAIVPVCQKPARQVRYRVLMIDVIRHH